MFKKSRNKIVIAIMSILVLLFAGTISIIYVSSYFDVMNENTRMLEEYVRNYKISPPAGEMRPGSEIGVPPQTIGKHRKEYPRFEISFFYSVIVSDTGKVLEVDNAEVSMYSEEDFSELALKVIESGRRTGTEGNLVYQVAEKENYILVAFLDNSVMMDSTEKLITYTIIFGSVALICLFFVALILANKIVAPLEESYKKQKQFISDAGHELKTPVAAVNANAELLSREIGENQWISNIQYENERMSALITQLLDLARTENVTPPMEEIDLSHLVGGEVLPLESVAYENGLVLNSKIEEHITVWGNNTQLKQLTSILVDNAIRHAFGSKEIWASLKTERGHAVLSVINSGEEITAEQRAHLFERFYRADEARTGEDKHYGLGLAIAKAIVETHHGKIEVRCYKGLVEFRATIPKL